MPVIGPQRVLTFGAQTTPPPAEALRGPASGRWGAGQPTSAQAAGRPSRLAAFLEVATSLSGVGLALFMLMHLSFLSSVLFGERYMDALASFLEDTYLLQIFAGPLILLAIAHIVLVARKLPAGLRQQYNLWVGLRQLGHLETWTWALQIFTGGAMVAFGAVHLWEQLTSLPIDSVKSGERVVSDYLRYNIPFLLLVEVHTFIGLYRVAVKWDLLTRGRAYLLFGAYALLAIGVGAAIVATFYRIGSGL